MTTTRRNLIDANLAEIPPTNPPHTPLEDRMAHAMMYGLSRLRIHFDVDGFTDARERWLRGFILEMMQAGCSSSTTRQWR